MADAHEADVGSQSAGTIKLNFIRCGRLALPRRKFQGCPPLISLGDACSSGAAFAREPPAAVSMPAFTPPAVDRDKIVTVRILAHRVVDGVA
jgi:hypothetical protein